MAKNTEAKKLEVNEEHLADPALWEGAKGEEYGGKSEILLLNVGDVAGPIAYVGRQNMTTDLGDTTVHTGTLKNETVRLPIQATFLRAIDQAGLKRGDTFIVKRMEDVTKKKGAGAGQPMAIYAIKVLNRAKVEGPF